MRQLHIRAQSGPRPVTVAGVRALLEARQIDPAGPVLSLDGGRTWQSVDSALAVLDGQAVDDGAIDHALRTGSLHPLATPLGVVAIAMLVCAIAFSGSAAAPVIRQAPTAVAVVAMAAADATATAAAQTVVAGTQAVAGVVHGFLHAGSSRPQIPAAAAPAAAGTVEAGPAPTAPTGDLLSEWRSLLADSERAADAWSAAAEALGKRTTAEGLAGWNVRLSGYEALTDANRASLTAGQVGGDKALGLAECSVNGITMLLLVADPALASSCAAMRKDGRDPRISARVTAVLHAAADRAVVFNGTLTAAE